MSERSETNVGLTDMLDGAAPRYTLPELIAELRREGTMKNRTWPCVLLKDLLPLCDDYERLEHDLRDARCLMWMMVHAVGGKVVIAVDEMQKFEREHVWLERTTGADGSLQMLAANHAPTNAELSRRQPAKRDDGRT